MYIVSLLTNNTFLLPTYTSLLLLNNVSPLPNDVSLQSFYTFTLPNNISSTLLKNVSALHQYPPPFPDNSMLPRRLSFLEIALASIIYFKVVTPYLIIWVTTQVAADIQTVANHCNYHVSEIKLTILIGKNWTAFLHPAWVAINYIQHLEDEWYEWCMTEEIE